MLSRWPIKRKLQIGVSLLAVIVLCLGINGLRGAYAYRGLARGISNRASELPITRELAQIATRLTRRGGSNRAADGRGRKPVPWE